MPETLTIVEAAFRDYALWQATILPRVSETLPGTGGMFRIVSAEAGFAGCDLRELSHQSEDRRRCNSGERMDQADRESIS